MNKQKWTLMLAGLALMAGSAAVLAWLHAHQKLGAPGLKSSPMPGTICRLIILPEQVLDYPSQWLEPSEVTTNTLPKDTSYGNRLYTAPDGFQISLNAVMMGTDRTSIHKPQYCLVGQGWNLGEARLEWLPVAKPHPYSLPVTKITASKTAMQDGRKVPLTGLYVYWFVADGAVTANHLQRMWWMASHLLQHGELQRWAYVSCFAVCRPGEEAATYERMRRFIAAAAPEFMLATTTTAAEPGRSPLTRAGTIAPDPGR